MPSNPLTPSKVTGIYWPDRRTWFTFLYCGAWLAVEWIVVYGGANWITGLHNYRVQLQTPIDPLVPFWPSAAIVYLSLFPLLWLSPVILQTPQRVTSFARTLAVLIAISGIGFLVLPCEPIEVSPIPRGVVGEIFRLADSINLSHNYFPSLHVGMAAGCAIAYSQTLSFKTAAFFWIWAVAIAISTLNTHQHNLVDVLVGGALGAFIAASFMPDTRQPPVN